MKILHVITNTELGGAQKVCIDLCSSAIAEGNSVAVASMAGGFLWNQLPKEVQQIQLINMVKPICLKKDFRVLFELKKAIKTYNPDIIHLHSSKAGVLGRLASIFRAKRVVYTVHGFDSIRKKYRIFLPLERILQFFCGAIVGVSEYDKKNLLSEGIRKNINVIYNGISNKAISPAVDFPVKLPDKKVVLTIARIAPPKQFKLFIDVALELPDYTFIWIGGSPNYSIDELKSVYAIPKNVILLGDVPNASNYIHFCDLFILLSDFEGLPMTIIEAMCQKKAIVASNVGGIPELVDNSNGRLVKNELIKVCSAINELLSNNDLINKMEEESYKKYEKSFTLRNTWNGYRTIYSSLLNNKE